MPLQQIDERVPVYSALQFTSADTPGVWVTVGVSNAYTRRWDVIQVVNTDTVDHAVGMDNINNDGTSPNGFGLAVAGAGDGAIVPLDLLDALFPIGFHYTFISPGENPAFTFTGAITAGKTVTIFLMGGLM